MAKSNIRGMAGTSGKRVSFISSCEDEIHILRVPLMFSNTVYFVPVRAASPHRSRKFGCGLSRRIQVIIRHIFSRVPDFSVTLIRLTEQK
ncbi:hypothetical protein X777_02549 [Ooceraea biroi]|uniref:Uncharacterized protein n=1 Tax=Ooceraea biroi TaxID=2015173 RepID=A0A026WMY2_OOCBI|nr:hypothetical protein X777_02549 [Ooceraea biroi]